MSESTVRRIAVIGGGIAGLTAALHLSWKRPDWKVVLFEASGRTGGVLETIYDPPYLIERSADNFATLVPDALDLCKATNYTEHLISPQPNGRQAFVVNGGRILPIPVGFSLVQPTRLWPILTTPTLSLSGKLRMLSEYFVPRRQTHQDESLESFATRRLGREAFENLVEPIVSGIFTADPARLSMQATLPQFVKMEREHGGLIRGYLAARREDAAAVARRASGARYDQFMAPKQGMSHWVQHLSAALPAGALRLNTPVKSLVRWPPGDNCAEPLWRVETSAGSESYDGVIIALPTRHAAALLRETDAALSGSLAAIEYASSAVAVVVADRHDIRARLDGFGLIVPAKERRPVLAISYSSNKYAGRTPDDQLLLRIFLGGALHPELLAQSDQQLLEIAATQLRQLLGWQGQKFRWQGMVRWNESMPQYHVGHTQRVAQFMEQSRQIGSLRLCGAGYSGVGIPQTIRSARAAVEELVQAWAQ